MDEFRQIRARDWALPLMAGAAGYMWASTMKEPTTFGAVVLSVSVIFGLWALFNAMHQAFDIGVHLWERVKEMNFKFTQNYKLEVMGRMTDYQIKAVRAGQFIVDIVPTDSGPVEMIRGTNVSCFAAWYILTRSTDYHLHPINNFKQETYHLDVLGDHATDDYTQAKEFHSWLYQNGIGEWGRGNMSMTWVNGWNKKKVMDAFGWDENTYEE